MSAHRNNTLWGNFSFIFLPLQIYLFILLNTLTFITRLESRLDSVVTLHRRSLPLIYITLVAKIRRAWNVQVVKWSAAYHFTTGLFWLETFGGKNRIKKRTRLKSYATAVKHIKYTNIYKCVLEIISFEKRYILVGNIRKTIGLRREKIS